MDMETQGLGAGSYPEPPEERYKLINGKIYISYEFENVEVPESWCNEKIEEDIREHLIDYTCNSTTNIEEIEL